MYAGQLSVEDALAAEGVRHGSDAEWWKEVGGPLWLRGRLSKGFVFYDLVSGNDL